MIEYYYLRQKGTQKFMPQLNGRGYTCTEFTLAGCPRLFSREHAAKVALTWWLRGRTTVKHYRYFEDDHESWHTEEVPTRKREDYEVVPVTLKEVRSL